MTWASPVFVGLSALAPLVIAVIAWLDAARRRTLLGRLGDVDTVRRMMASASPRRRFVKWILQAAGLSLICLAVARPQRPGHTRSDLESLDLVVALDVSKSMMVDDLGGTRVARGRALVASLLEALTNDRVAPVVFAGAAAHFPLTEDKNVALEIMTDIGPADLPPGSELAEAVRVSTCLLRPDLGGSWDSDCGDVGGRGHGGDPIFGEASDENPVEVVPEPIEQEERAKVIVLITDGADGLVGGSTDGDDRKLVQAVREAVALGITMIVVGVGTETGGAIPDLDRHGAPAGFKRDDDGNVRVSRLDRTSLQQLAEAAGDRRRYVELAALPMDRGRVDATRIIDLLSALKRGALERSGRRTKDELYQVFLFPGFILLVIEACIAARRRVRYPEQAA